MSYPLPPMGLEVILIVARGSNGAIGAKGRLPWSLPDDLARFKKLTLGHTVLMGRKTFQSIGRPLPDRRNIVISRSGFTADGVETMPELQRALSTLALAIDRNLTRRSVFVIGGGEIYTQALPHAHKAYVTHVDAAPDGDAFFPDLDPSRWKAGKAVEQPARDGQPSFRYITYERL